MNFKVIPLTLSILLLASCGIQEASTVEKKSETFTLKREMISENLSLTGTLEAIKETPIATKMPGRIAELHVDIGDKVFEGQILGLLAADETAVGAETARLNEANMQNTYVSQKQLLDAQVRNAEKALELAKTNLEAVQTSQGDTKLSTEEQIKLAEKQVEQAQTQLTNVQSLANQRMATLYKNARSAIRGALISVTNANNFADNILGISKEKEHLNDSFEVNLGSLNSSSKTIAENALRNSLAKKDLFKKLYDSSIETREPSYEEYDSYLDTALEALESTQSMLNQLYTLLDHSTSGSNFLESQLATLKQENLIHGQNTEAAILSVSGGIKLGVKGVILTKDEILTQNQAELSTAEKGVAQAQQALNQIKAGTSQNRSSIQSQKSIVEKQLEQAKSVLESTKAQRDSALKELTQQMDLIKGNVKLSEVYLGNTQFTAPFSGIVTEKIAEVGQVVGAGQPIFSIADMSAFKIKTDIPDTALKHVQEGNEAEIQLDGVSGTFKSVVSKIYPKVDPITRKIGIELLVYEAPQATRVGMFARITLKSPEKEAYFVPKSFVFSSNTGPFVILRNGEKRNVATGIEQGNKIKIWLDGEMEGVILSNK